ncbi:MAG: flavodoxin family protein [Woeseiaceae bacterium]
MNDKRRILAINGSYRTGGITDQAIASLTTDLQALDVEVEEIRLRDYPIEFCTNCRECMQQPGDAPGRCIHDDGMAALVAKIEAADGYVLAAPTNLSTVTALYKRFSERLAIYAYWPWERPGPTLRKAKATRKPTVILWSCAAPAIMGRIAFSTGKSLKTTADAIGGDVVGTVLTGLVPRDPKPVLPERAKSKARALASKLAA